MTVDCMRIVTMPNRDDPSGKKWLGIVKDTCDGCEIDSEHCAINDMLEDLGIVESWANWDMPNFRDRIKEG